MIVVLQFDAVNLPRFQALIEEGRLPTLQKLQARGHWQSLETPALAWEGATYYSLYSGLSMTDHGLYFPFMWSASEQRVRPQTDFPAPEFVWDRIGRAGHRALVVDPYDTCRVPHSLHGKAISGWQFRHKVTVPSWSIPKSLSRDLQRRFGRAPMLEEVYGRPSARYLRDMSRQLLDAPRRAGEAAGYLLSQEQFDMVWITLSSAHLAGHWFLDPGRLPRDDFDQRTIDRIDTILDDTYIAVDQAVGSILESLPPDADIILMSASGMGPNSSRTHLLPDILKAILAPEGASKPGQAAAPSSSLWRLRAAIPQGLRLAVARALPDRLTLELTARLDTRGMDWSKTRAFMMPSGDPGMVRINLQGRERDGIVEPADVPALTELIASGLKTFRDADRAPIVKKIEMTSENLGIRPLAHPFPDMIVHWSDQLPDQVEGVWSPEFGGVQSPGWGSGRTGEHCDGAWALFVPGNSRLSAPGQTPHIVDVAATICGVLGVDRQELAGQSLLEPPGGS